MTWWLVGPSVCPGSVETSGHLTPVTLELRAPGSIHLLACVPSSTSCLLPLLSPPPGQKTGFSEARTQPRGTLVPLPFSSKKTNDPSSRGSDLLGVRQQLAGNWPPGLRANSQANAQTKAEVLSGTQPGCFLKVNFMCVFVFFKLKVLSLYLYD